MEMLLISFSATQTVCAPAVGHAHHPERQQRIGASLEPGDVGALRIADEAVAALAIAMPVRAMNSFSCSGSRLLTFSAKIERST